MKPIFLVTTLLLSVQLHAQLANANESSLQTTSFNQLLSQIDLPVTFEDTSIDYTVTDFGGNASSLIVDPSDATNHVIQVIKTQGAETWAGTTIGTASGFATAIPLTATDSKMSVRVWSPAAALPIRLKVEDANDNTHTCETEVNTTIANAWETLTFDFSQQATGTEPLSTGLSNGWVYNKASIFFNFGTAGDTEMTFYFDDVNHLIGGGNPNVLAQIDLPVTFEDTTVNYTVTDFGGNVSSFIIDPNDANNHVMKVVKTQGAETWAGTTIGTATGFASAIPFTTSDTKMNVKVWSPAADLPIRLKVEDANDNTHTCETEVNTTIANAWETLTFDFSQHVTGTEPLSTGLSNSWVYNKASIFFNFGTAGDTEMTFYFDDVKFGETEVGMMDFETTVQIYPNPSSTHWKISSHDEIDEVVLIDVLGKMVASFSVQKQHFSIDARPFDSGMYFARVKTLQSEFTAVLIRK